MLSDLSSAISAISDSTVKLIINEPAPKKDKLKSLRAEIGKPSKPIAIKDPPNNRSNLCNQRRLRESLVLFLSIRSMVKKNAKIQGIKYRKQE